MNCVVFAKMDQVFSLKKTLKKYLKNGKNTGNLGKVREFCLSGKVGTMLQSCVCSPDLLCGNKHRQTDKLPMYCLPWDVYLKCCPTWSVLLKQPQDKNAFQ